MADPSRVVDLELALLDPRVRRSREAVLALLHPEMVEIGASGRVWHREQLADALAADPAVSGRPEEIEAAELADGVVLVTYRVRGRRNTVRSSLWLRTPAGWQLRFHQGTVA